eukprot:1161826-Pelagomonas_calceolata.AAC.2
MQQSASKLRAKKGPSRSTSASSYPSTRPTRQVPGVWTPALQKAISEAAHVLAERRSQKPYTTNVDVTSPDPNETLRSLQEACRVSCKSLFATAYCFWKLVQNHPSDNVVVLRADPRRILPT